MPDKQEHVPGMLCWAELATSDEKAALRFYGSLLGWKDNPLPMGPGSFYHMQQVRGLDAAAISQQQEAERQQGIPAHWTLHFAVASADDAARKATQAGGRVLAGPMDVFDAGRMAVLQDTEGAVFAVWQARSHIGARVMSEPGAITWGELMSNNPQGAVAFYTATLPVQAEKMPGPMDYTLFKAGGKESVGMMRITPEMGPMPPCWMVYFYVADVDASAKKATSLRGKVLKPAGDIPSVGRFAVLQDPQGAVFCIFKSTMA